MFKRACIAFGLLQFSHSPLGGRWPLLCCGGGGCCPLPAHFLAQPSWLLSLSHRHNHLATVSVAVERTGILGLAPLSRSPLRPWLVGSHQRHHLLAMARHGSFHLQSSKGFRVGHSSVTAPAGLAGCRLNRHTACPCSLPPGGDGAAGCQMWHCPAKVCECAITNFESNFFFYTAKLRLGSICKVRRCFSRNLQPFG